MGMLLCRREEHIAAEREAVRALAAERLERRRDLERHRASATRRPRTQRRQRLVGATVLKDVRSHTREGAELGATVRFTATVSGGL